MTSDISPLIQEKAPLILTEIKKATSILLHCHPSPDPDSVGSALAMKFALEQLGKKATVIAGDSPIPQAFMHFPGATSIVTKNFFEVDLSKFDLFIAQDSGSVQMISRKGEVRFPPSLKVIDIDHHPTNENYGAINLVESSYPSCCQMLFDLFKEWGIKITPEIAKNLFVGTYTDTGGFRFPKTTAYTLRMAAELTHIAPDFPQLLASMDDSNTPGFIAFQGLALNSVETFLGDNVAISAVSFDAMKEKNITLVDLGSHNIANLLKTVIGWNVAVALAETEPGKVKANFRTRNSERFDVTRIAVAFGGGGHKAAAGATLNMPLDEAKKAVVAKAKELYNL